MDRYVSPQLEQHEETIDRQIDEIRSIVGQHLDTLRDSLSDASKSLMAHGLDKGTQLFEFLRTSVSPSKHQQKVDPDEITVPLRTSESKHSGMKVD